MGGAGPCAGEGLCLREIRAQEHVPVGWVLITPPGLSFLLPQVTISLGPAYFCLAAGQDQKLSLGLGNMASSLTLKAGDSDRCKGLSLIRYLQVV